MLRFRQSRKARILAVAVLAVAGPLALPSVLAVSQIRHVAAALRIREDEALRQCARAASQELAYRVLQSEGEALRFLDLESPESLTQSLDMAESVFPGMTGFVLLRNGAFLYPAAGEAIRSPGLAAVREDAAGSFGALDANGVGRLFRVVDGRPVAISLHEMAAAGLTGAVGMAWGPASVAEWARAVEAAVLPPRYALDVLDDRDRVLFGADAAPAPAADRADAALCAVHDLPADLFPWRARVRPRDAAEIGRIVRREVAVAAGTLLFLVGLIAAGAWMLVAMTLREVKLARLKADFAANMSHELRTPLALIRAAGESLASRPDLPKAQSDRYVGIVLKECRRLTELVNTVLDFSRIEQRRKPHDLQPRDLVALVSDVAQSYRALAEDQGFAFRVQVPDEPLLAPLDPEAFRLVLVNLLDNAVKFSAERREIAVGVARDGRDAVMTVRDRGVGIAPEHRERIFESFYRVEGDGVKKTRGTGIGLALARHIVDAHRGRIEVESREGEGSTFTVRLPLAAE